MRINEHRRGDVHRPAGRLARPAVDEKERVESNRIMHDTVGGATPATGASAIERIAHVSPILVNEPPAIRLKGLAGAVGEAQAGDVAAGVAFEPEGEGDRLAIDFRVRAARLEQGIFPAGVEAVIDAEAGTEFDR